MMNAKIARTSKVMLAALVATAAYVSDFTVPHSTWTMDLADRQPVTRLSVIDQLSQAAFEDAVAGSTGNYSILSKRPRFDDKRGRGRRGLTQPTVSEETYMAKRPRFDDKRGRGRLGLTQPIVSEEILMAKRIKFDDKRGRGRTG
jgi:hypothetical protein